MSTESRADLLVMNTKDDQHLAMHAVAYPLARELRDIPLLMLQALRKWGANRPLFESWSAVA